MSLDSADSYINNQLGVYARPLISEVTEVRSLTLHTIVTPFQEELQSLSFSTASMFVQLAEAVNSIHPLRLYSGSGPAEDLSSQVH